VLKSYTMEQLVGLGISWVWTGLEGEDSRYQKLKKVDTHAFVRSLQSNGICVLGSSIIGMENHTPENIDQVIDHAISHNTDFHQFMLYTPIPGTKLHAEHKADGTLLPESEVPVCDAHGQYRFNYKHEHIRNGMEGEYLLNAFRRDFQVNGPSIGRLIETTFKGWEKYKNHPDKRIRRRFISNAKMLRTTYAGAVWAIKKWARGNDPVEAKMGALLNSLYREFGWKTRLFAPLAGSYLYHNLKKEDVRLQNGWNYEPHAFYEKNSAALALEQQRKGKRILKTTVPWVTGDLSPVFGRGPAGALAPK
jgi:hypothetical protein